MVLRDAPHATHGKAIDYNAALEARHLICLVQEEFSV